MHITKGMDWIEDEWVFKPKQLRFDNGVEREGDVHRTRTVWYQKNESFQITSRSS